MKKILKKSVLAAVVICLSAFLLIGCQSNKNLVATVNGTDITEEQLQENFDAILSAIMKAKPAAVKGAYLKSVTLTSTMGPGVRMNAVKLMNV